MEMEPSPESIKTTVYTKVTGDPILQALEDGKFTEIEKKALLIGLPYKDQPHWEYPLVLCRVKTKLEGQILIVEADKSGKAYFLPYKENAITSMQLPGIPVEAMGVTLFLTAAMSGCKFFIDKVEGSNDLVIFHANAKALQIQGATDEMVVAGLDKMHDEAVKNYEAKGLMLKHSTSLAKARYYRLAVEEGKSVMGWAEKVTDKIKPEFLGAACIMGFYEPGGWDFHYQTSGKWTRKNDTIAQMNKVNVNIVDYAKFYSRVDGPVP